MRRRRLSVIATLMAALLLGGCGDDSSRSAAPRPTAAPPLHSFDLYAMGSADGNILFADLYGIMLNPLTVHRITVDKRISTLSASREVIAVAAGDEQIDKLALVQEGGVLVPIPGLGRPHAYSPQVRPDGSIRYEDAGPDDDSSVNGRYLEYNARTGRGRVLFESAGELNVAGTVPGGLFLELLHRDGADDQVAVVQRNGDRKRYTIAPRIGGAAAGRRFVAVAVFASDDPAVEPAATALLDLDGGSIVQVPGWVPLAWNPDRTTLLVSRIPAQGPGDTQLALVDPRRPREVRPVGVVSGVVLYSASWVAGDAPTAGRL